MNLIPFPFSFSDQPIDNIECVNHELNQWNSNGEKKKRKWMNEQVLPDETHFLIMNPIWIIIFLVQIFKINYWQQELKLNQFFDHFKHSICNREKNFLNDRHLPTKLWKISPLQFFFGKFLLFFLLAHRKW